MYLINMKDNSKLVKRRISINTEDSDDIKNLTECECCHEKFSNSASDRIITFQGELKVICGHCAYKQFVLGE